MALLSMIPIFGFVLHFLKVFLILLTLHFDILLSSTLHYLRFGFSISVVSNSELHNCRSLPNIEEAWKLPIPAELTTRTVRLVQQVRMCVSTAANNRENSSFISVFVANCVYDNHFCYFY